MSDQAPDRAAHSPAAPSGAPDARATPTVPAATRGGSAAAARAEYPDLRYRDVFWPGRDYEDACDRRALGALLPPPGARRGRLLEVGAGFGRLADEYRGFDEVVLLDPSSAHLAAARERFAGQPRVRVAQGDAFDLPFEAASVDVVVCVRVLHHFADPRPALAEFARVLRPGGLLVLEHANKRNLKAIVRYLLRRQAWSPFAPGPAPYREVHLDHAPADVRRWLRSAGFRIEATRTASLLRWRPLSRRLPLGLLLAVERPLQAWLAPATAGPSMFLAARRRSGR
ncbi:MAG TPA: methyltransferase domain-containing protein [Candidatus Limnocylindrales bacterium]